jgi:hypothetical protein
VVKRHCGGMDFFKGFVRETGIFLLLVVLLILLPSQVFLFIFNVVGFHELVNLPKMSFESAYWLTAIFCTIYICFLAIYENLLDRRDREGRS